MDQTTDKKVQDKKEQKIYTAEEFATLYNKLVEDTGWKVVASPIWVPTNHGSFEMTIRMSVEKMPEKT